MSAIQQNLGFNTFTTPCFTASKLAGCLAAVLPFIAVSKSDAQGGQANPYSQGTPNHAQFRFSKDQKVPYTYGMYSSPFSIGYLPEFTPTPSTIPTNSYIPGMAPQNPYLPIPSGPTSGGTGGYGEGSGGPFANIELLNAYGQFSNQVEQSRIMREQALQAKLVTAKERFDLQLYIKANTPTFTQQQAKIANVRLRRIQANSTNAEISNGTSINILLDDTRRILGKQVNVVPIVLGEEILKQINVIKWSGNLGLLREDGVFAWPVGLVKLLNAEEKRRIEISAQMLVRQAAKEQLNADLLRDLGNLLQIASDKLALRVNEIPASDYLDAKRFLDDFRSAKTALEQGEASTWQQYRKFVTGGKSVQEVTAYLIANGLKIAPATRNDEGAYRAFHYALAAFDVALHAALPERE